MRRNKRIRTLVNSALLLFTLGGTSGCTLILTSSDSSCGNIPYFTIDNTSERPIEDLAKQETLARYGGNCQAWQEVQYILGRESSFNPYAVNSDSGACGLPQADPCSKMLNQISTLDNTQGQLEWFFNYIDSQYGGPDGAYTHEQTYGWY